MSGLIAVREKVFASRLIASLILVALIGCLTSIVHAAPSDYDQTVLADGPTAFWDMKTPDKSSETDLTGNKHTGKYVGSPSLTRPLPNGRPAALFNGSTQYMSVPDSNDFSITQAKKLTVEAWISPDSLTQSLTGDYVYWIGKGTTKNKNNEWKGRFYNKFNTDGRPNRISGYAYNPSGDLGSGAYWQPADSSLSPQQWLYVVVEYQTITTPNICANYLNGEPGTIDIWVDGVKWYTPYQHGLAGGCMSQFGVKPKNGSGAVVVGTDLSFYFKGAVGKVAIYKKLLEQTQISNHWTTMTGKPVVGSCTADSCTLN